MAKTTTIWTCVKCGKEQSISGPFNPRRQVQPDGWTTNERCPQCSTPVSQWYDDLCVEVSLSDVLVNRNHPNDDWIDDAVTILCSGQYGTYHDDRNGHEW